MGVLEFVGVLIGHLAWPLLVLFLVLFLAKPIKNLLNSDRPVRSIKAGPGGLEIQYVEQLLGDAREELKEVKEEERLLIPPAERVDEPSPALPPEDDLTTELRQVAQISPRAAVLEAFARLERTLRETVPEHPRYKQQGRYPTVRSLGRQAVELGLWPDSAMNALNDITTARNLIAHEHLALETNTAETYVELAQELIHTLTVR